MIIFAAYIKGFFKSTSNWMMLILIWSLNLVLALLLAIPFYAVSKGTSGNSMLPHELLSDFNFTAAIEWLRKSGNIPGTFIILAVSIAVGYCLLWVFLSGGIIQSLSRSRFTKKLFWNGSTKNFFRFLGVSVIILIIQVILAVIVFVGISVVLKRLKETAVSEDEYVSWILGGGVLYLLFWLFWSAVSDYAKFYLVRNNSINVFGALFRTFIFAITHFFKVYLLRLLLFLTPLPIWYIFLKVTGNMVGVTAIGTIVLFLMRQLFLIVRIWCRVWVYSSQLNMFSVYFPNNKQINIELRRKAKLEKAAKKANKSNPLPDMETSSESESQ